MNFSKDLKKLLISTQSQESSAQPECIESTHRNWQVCSSQAGHYYAINQEDYIPSGRAIIYKAYQINKENFWRKT